MTYLLKGKPIAETILSDITTRVQALFASYTRVPRLAVILVGNESASETYVAKKQQAAERVGILFDLHRYPANITQEELIQQIDHIGQDPTVSGMIVQLPIPEHLYTPQVLNAIPPQKDVDCLTNERIGQLAMNTASLVPPTPGAVFALLHTHNISVAGKRVTVIGMGALVGKPLTMMLVNAKATVTTCNSQTKHLRDICLASDIIITGVGKPHLVTADMVRPGTVVVDTGISFVNNVMYGDVDATALADNDVFVTPTPGGIGPITVAQLLLNTVIVAEKQA
jgi:methylenetetrahydrofolate dehydrogenase (NADP+)/methenyltetrahydrofolate cyclohydrolase